MDMPALQRENRKLKQQIVTLEQALAERSRQYDPLAESELVRQAIDVAIKRGLAQGTHLGCSS